MDKYELIHKIENFAPLETQESWDASGWAVETKNKDIKKVLLCLTVTRDIIEQSKGFDIIISHHPLFFVPLNWKDIDIYCAHTNFDLAKGGTTDTLIEDIFQGCEYKKTHSDGFARYVEIDIEFDKLIKLLRKISPNLRYVNNCNTKKIKKIAFCAGSGSDFINEAFEYGADVFVTGDLKFHTALESPLAIVDLGHFESEIGSLKVFEKLIKDGVEIQYAKEESPFKY